MAKYMFLGGYSPSSWERMMANPGKREAAVSDLCKKAGGKLEALYWTTGADDYMVIADFPDEASAYGISVAMSSSGEVHDQRTVKLITQEESVSLLEKANGLESEYRVPGA